MDYLPKSEQGEKTFDLFCDALIADSQSNIVKSYLKLENTKEAEKKGGNIEESSGSSDVDNKVSLLTGTTCIQAGHSEEGRSSSDYPVGSPGLAPQVAIREEFQQQLYRRSIEPREIHRSQSSPVMESSQEHEARIFYENCLRNQVAVNHVLNDRCSSKTEKEKQLFNMGLPVSSVSQVLDNFYMPTVNDKLFVRDSGGKLPKCMSSKEFSEKAFAQAPSVFHLSPQKEINMSSMSQSIGTDSQRPFAFHTKDQNFSTQSVFLETDSLSAKEAYEMARIRGRGSEVENTYRQQMLGPSGKNLSNQYKENNEIINQARKSVLPSQEIHSSQSRIYGDDNVIEMERYIEMTTSGEGQKRSVVAFPRHVTMLPAAHQSDLHGQEFVRGENCSPSRLARNDSVGMY